LLQKLKDKKMKSFEDNSLLQKTLSDIVRDNFKSAAVFEKYELDYCCHGKRQFLEAVNEKNISLTELISDLESLEPATDALDVDFTVVELDSLAEYIITTHHSFVREKLPFITELGRRVVQAHGAKHPEVFEITALFAQVHSELESHMMKEERILFPEIIKLARAERGELPYTRPPFNTIMNPIHVMEAEHISTGDAFEKIGQLSASFTPPSDACNTFKVFYAELDGFEKDLHRHIHLENNILFPKALALEESFN